MFNISGFLEKFKKQVQSDELSQKEICDVVIKHTGITCKQNNIEIKNYILYINLSPTFKQKVFMHKKQILKDLEKISSTKIVDVR
jgi:hypothetical protein